MDFELETPIADDQIRRLKTGDVVALSGIIVTARDAAHQWLTDCFVHHKVVPTNEDHQIFDQLQLYLNGGILYHCGPVVSKLESGGYRFVAAGPTTSIREEPYQADVMRLFNLKGVIGKGGMGAKTLRACGEGPAVYFHAVGGAAALIAATVKEVVDVYKLEFGTPEAMWVIRVEKMPVVVTMDANGESLHDQVRKASTMKLDQLLGR